MIKTLITNIDKNYSQNIINYIVCAFKNIQLSCIATNKEDIIMTVKNNNIDLIILDSEIYKKELIYLLDQIHNLYLNKKPTIIILSQNTINISANNLVDLIIYDKESSEIIQNKICTLKDKMIKYKKTNKEKIIEELLKLGFNFKYKGTQYLLESILYIYKSNDFIMLDNLEKYVYPKIATINKKTINNIKTNIIKATNWTYEYQEKEVFEKYFYCDIKPTPKTIITIVLNKLIL